MATEKVAVPAQGGSANLGDPPPGSKRLVGVKVVAAKYDCDKRSVLRYADAGIIPFGFKLGSLRRWDVDEIDAHISAGLPRVRPLKPKPRD